MNWDKHFKLLLPFGGRGSKLSDQTPAETTSISLKFTLAMMGLVIVSTAATGTLNWWWASGLSEAPQAASGQLWIQTFFVDLFFCGAAFVVDTDGGTRTR